jgi:hypothetical protein
MPAGKCGQGYEIISIFHFPNPPLSPIREEVAPLWVLEPIFEELEARFARSFKLVDLSLLQNSCI